MDKYDDKGGRSSLPETLHASILPGPSSNTTDLHRAASVGSSGTTTTTTGGGGRSTGTESVGERSEDLASSIASSYAYPPSSSSRHSSVSAPAPQTIDHSFSRFLASDGSYPSTAPPPQAATGFHHHYPSFAASSSNTHPYSYPSTRDTRSYDDLATTYQQPPRDYGHRPFYPRQQAPPPVDYSSGYRQSPLPLSGGSYTVVDYPSPSSSTSYSLSASRRLPQPPELRSRDPTIHSSSRGAQYAPSQRFAEQPHRQTILDYPSLAPAKSESSSLYDSGTSNSFRLPEQHFFSSRDHGDYHQSHPSTSQPTFDQRRESYSPELERIRYPPDRRYNASQSEVSLPLPRISLGPSRSSTTLVEDQPQYQSHGVHSGFGASSTTLVAAPDDDNSGSEPRDFDLPLDNRRRKKIAIACQYCRKRKLRCDGSRPMCTECIRKGEACSYVSHVRRRGPGKAPKGSRPRKKQRRGNPDSMIFREAGASIVGEPPVDLVHDPQLERGLPPPASGLAPLEPGPGLYMGGGLPQLGVGGGERLERVQSRCSSSSYGYGVDGVYEPEDTVGGRSSSLRSTVRGGESFPYGQ